MIRESESILKLGGDLIQVERVRWLITGNERTPEYRLIGRAIWTQRRGHPGRLVSIHQGDVSLEEPMGSVAWLDYLDEAYSEPEPGWWKRLLAWRPLR